jgi:transmembrane sensor
MASANTPIHARPGKRYLEFALLLIARQHGGDPATAAAARASLEDWRQADPAHDQAYRAALNGWQATEAGALRDAIPLPASQAARAQGRRRVLASLGIAGLMLALGGGGRWAWQQPTHELSLASSHGEMRQAMLPDGSRLDLAAHTSAHVTFYRDRREVRLDQGEIRFDVHPETARPFTVATAWGRVRVLGTVFTVAALDGRMRVAVAEGRVAVWGSRQSAADTPPALELGAGQSVQIDAGGMGMPGAIRPDQVGAWREGWLVFDAEPLPDVVARWNDYLATPIRLTDDPGLRRLRLTGSYPMRDAQAFVASLPQVLPVDVEWQGEEGLLIHARH